MVHPVICVAEPVQIAKPHGLVRYTRGTRKNSLRSGNPGIRTSPYVIMNGACNFVTVFLHSFLFDCQPCCFQLVLLSNDAWSGGDIYLTWVLQNLKHMVKERMIIHFPDTREIS